MLSATQAEELTSTSVSPILANWKTELLKKIENGIKHVAESGGGSGFQFEFFPPKGIYKELQYQARKDIILELKKLGYSVYVIRTKYTEKGIDPRNYNQTFVTWNLTQLANLEDYVKEINGDSDRSIIEEQ